MNSMNTNGAKSGWTLRLVYDLFAVKLNMNKLVV